MSFQKRLESIKNLKDRCLDSVNELRRYLDDPEKHEPMIDVWIEDLVKVTNKLTVPQTAIAVVGDSGGGKSTLINALLGVDLLPTSGMGKSCTAVMVVVEANKQSSKKFEATIDFLTEKEWEDEEQTLLKDLNLASVDNLSTVNRAKLTEHQLPSFDKLRAVYGVNNKQKLKKKIKGHLKDGKKKIASSEIEKFKEEITRYIETPDQNSQIGDDIQLWPIIKKVTLNVPKKIYRDDGSFIDLPGLGDSNMARNNLAEKCLTECNSVWIVMEMKRANTSKTADDFLRKETLRKLFINGQFAGLVFICTHSDSIDLDEVEKKQKLPLDTKTEIIKKRKLRDDIEKNLLETNDIQLLQDLKSTEKAIQDLEKERMNICVQGRNKKIEKDMMENFRAAVLEDILDEASDSESDSGDSLEASITQEEDILKNVKVFCCSAREYMKLKNHEQATFPNKELTNIPRLQEFVQDIKYQRQQRALETAKRHLHIFLEEVQSFLEKGDQTNYIGAKEAIEGHLREFQDDIKEKLKCLKENLYCELKKIKQKLDKGVSRCEAEATSISQKWGEKRKSGGLHHNTYIAAVKRQGILSGRHQVNLNADLAKPLYEGGSFIGSWKGVFERELPERIKHLKETVANHWKKTLEIVFKAVESQTSRFVDHQMEFASMQLDDMEADMQELIEQHQKRDWNIFEDVIKSELTLVYNDCNKPRGKKKPLEHVKNCMESGVDAKKTIIFRKAASEVEKELDALQEQLEGKAKEELEFLVPRLEIFLKKFEGPPDQWTNDLKRVVEEHVHHLSEIDSDFTALKKDYFKESQGESPAGISSITTTGSGLPVAACSSVSSFNKRSSSELVNPSPSKKACL